MTCAALCVPHSTAVFDREQHTLSLPAANSITYVLRFLEKLCHNLRSDNLFGNQPFAQTHGHARYLPGRSWDGAGVKKGGRARRSGGKAQGQPSALLAWHLLPGNLVFCP